MFNTHYGAIFCKSSLESMFPLGLGDQALGSPIYFGKATNVWAPKAAVPAGKQWPEVTQLNAGVT